MDKQITWTVAAISEFAKAKALSVKQAFNYLSLFKGMDFTMCKPYKDFGQSFYFKTEKVIAFLQKRPTV